jgi:SAM-dependent methyltransferase
MTDHALAAYETLAPEYDFFTAHHDYEVWTAALEQVARDAGLRGRRLLDVACGTGKSFLPYLARGYEVTACDISPAMVELAAAKCDGAVRLAVHDVRTLPVLGEFDLVQCVDDALNYLLSDADLTAALAAMRANLAPGGVLVFDLNTLLVYRTFFASTSVVQEDGRVLIWEGSAEPDLPAGAAVEATLDAVVRGPDDVWTRSTSLHRQRHHPEHVVREAAAAAGLSVAGCYGARIDGSLSPGFDEAVSTKVVYVLHASEEGR